MTPKDDVKPDGWIAIYKGVTMQHAGETPGLYIPLWLNHGEIVTEYGANPSYQIKGAKLIPLEQYSEIMEALADSAAFLCKESNYHAPEDTGEIQGYHERVTKLLTELKK